MHNTIPIRRCTQANVSELRERVMAWPASLYRDRLRREAGPSRINDVVDR